MVKPSPHEVKPQVKAESWDVPLAGRLAAAPGVMLATSSLCLPCLGHSRCSMRVSEVMNASPQGSWGRPYAEDTLSRVSFVL